MNAYIICLNLSLINFTLSECNPKLYKTLSSFLVFTYK